MAVHKEFTMPCMGVDAKVDYDGDHKVAFVPAYPKLERFTINVDMEALRADGYQWFPCPMADCDIFIVPNGKGLIASCALCQSKVVMETI